jgi:ribosomal protein S18 acetylase RimI-like enzyme
MSSASEHFVIESALSERPLESGLFGCRVYAASADSMPELQRALDAARILGGALVVVRVPAHQVAAIHAVETAGGRLCDVLVTLTGPFVPSSTATTPRSDLTIRRALPGDADALSELATRSFHSGTTHWHSDPRLPGELSDRLYGRWAAALARDSTDATPLWVAETRDHAMAGFLSLSPQGQDAWNVPLTGVAPECRGRGILSAMLDAGAATCRQRGARQTLHYETQLTNLSALRAVIRRGLTVDSSRLTFHLWVPE